MLTLGCDLEVKIKVIGIVNFYVPSMTMAGALSVTPVRPNTPTGTYVAKKLGQFAIEVYICEFKCSLLRKMYTNNFFLHGKPPMRIFHFSVHIPNR